MPLEAPVIKIFWSRKHFTRKPYHGSERRAGLTSVVRERSIQEEQIVGGHEQGASTRSNDPGGPSGDGLGNVMVGEASGCSIGWLGW